MSEALAVADDMLRSFFERWQRLEEAKQEISDDLKELFAEAKGVGFDTKAMRAVFREQVGDKDAKNEFDAICDLYRASLERPSARPAPAREKTLKNSPQSQEVVTPVARAKPAHAESQGGEISATHSNSQAAVLPVAAKPEPVPPSAGSGTLSPATAPPVAAPEPTPVPTNGSGAPIPDSAVPAFLLKDRKPYVLRPHCAHPDDLEKCAGVGSKHCHECERATARVTEDAA